MVIFICKGSLGEGFDEPIYTFRMQSQEVPETYLEDDNWTVLVNAQCDSDGLSLEMQNFLSFIKTGKVASETDDLPNRLRNAVLEAKRTKKWSVEYMRWEDELNHRFYLGVQQEKKNTEAERQRADEAERRADAAEAELARLKAQYGIK